jgi:hypothetical protein
MSIHIISGRLYNTETAAAVESGSATSSDSRSWEEKLYRTKKGTFFIVGSGGAGSVARTVTPEAALQWGEERRIDPEVLGQYFGDLIKEG